MYHTILKFITKSSPISIVNLKQKTDSKFEVRIKAFKKNAGDHHQKLQLLDEDDGLKTKSKTILNNNILNKQQQQQSPDKMGNEA